MSSFFETTEEATTDVQDINNKFLTQLKTYTFFVFYKIADKKKATLSTLDKMDFKLRSEKSTSSDNFQQEKNKQVEIKFYDVENEQEVLTAISDIRNYSHESKAKIVVNATEAQFTDLVLQFQEFKVDINNIPMVFNSTNYKSDLSYFLGWKEEIRDCIAAQSLPFYQEASRNWIKATAEKIDIWKAEVTVSKEKGRILKVDNNELREVQDQKMFSQCFLSHFCIGYHADLLVKYKSKIKGNQETFGNSFIESLQKFKKFCCVGSNTLRKTTGIVNISLIDEKGEELEILKQLRSGDSSEEESQAELGKRGSKYRQYKDVLSILLTNLNVFQGNELDKCVEGKMNDNKLQLLTFDSEKSHRKICSSQSQIKIKFDAESVDLQIGESGYKLEHPDEVKITFHKKIKIGIQQVKC